jgi:hypothetical protein
MPPLNYRNLLPRDLDSQQDPTLSEVNSRLKELYDGVNTALGYRGPVPLANHINLQGNRILNLGAAQAPTDALSQTAADPLYSTAVQQSELEATGNSILQTTRRLNSAAQQQLISSDLNSQGSIPPVITGLTMYTSTSTTLTVSFPTQIQFGDLSIIAIPNIPVTITGLTTGPYYIYPYYDTALGIGSLVAIAGDGVGAPPCCFAAVDANAAQIQNADGHVPLSIGGIPVTVGSSGGHGGSQCIRYGMVVKSQEHGVIPIESVFIGEMIKARNGWTRVTYRRIGHAGLFIRIGTSNGEGVDVTPTHPICLFEGGHKEVRGLTLADVLCGEEEVPLQITSLLTVEETSPIVLLSCDPTHEYLVGRFKPTIVAHNFINNK